MKLKNAGKLGKRKKKVQNAVLVHGQDIIVYYQIGSVDVDFCRHRLMRMDHQNFARQSHQGTLFSMDSFFH